MLMLRPRSQTQKKTMKRDLTARNTDNSIINPEVVNFNLCVHLYIIYHSAGKHDHGPLFFTLCSFRLIRSRSAGSI